MLDAIDPPLDRPFAPWKRCLVALLACGLAAWATYAEWTSSVAVVGVAVVTVIWACHGIVASALRHFVPVALRPYLGAAIGCVVVAFLTIWPQNGFLLVVVAIPLAVWVAASIVVVLMKREQLRARAIQFGMWLATILLVSGVQWYYTVDARREGDVAVRAIERYHDNHGSYPPDIATAGLSNGRTRYKLYYRLVDGEPALGYPTTFGMFDSYDYDFAQRTWTYSPD